MPGTNSGLGGFMNGASIRFSKFKGGGGLGRDGAMLAAASNKYGTARPRTTGRELPKLHTIHSGTVVSMQPFGAFVQLGDGAKYKDGLLHVSCLCEERVESPEQAGLEQGMKVWVKVSELKEEDGKYSLDLRYVNQVDGTDLDPYQAKGRLPDNNFTPAGSRPAVRRPIPSAEAAGGGRLGGGGASELVAQGGGPSPPVRSTALAGDRSGTPLATKVDRGPPAEEEYEKVMRKLEKARSKLEHAKKKEEKARRSELEKEKSKKRNKEERRGEKEGKRERRDDELRGRHKTTRREEAEDEEEEQEKLDRKLKERRRRKREDDDSDS